MRWVRIRKASIDEKHRQMFEELGVEVVRAFLPEGIGVVLYEEKRGENVEKWTVGNLRESMKPWLREQYDVQERRESWNLAMEVAITVFVASELAISLYGFWRG